MLSADQAWQCVVERTQPLPTKWMPPTEALHRCLATSIAADRDIPAHDRSAMDGYAVRSADLSAVPAELRVVAEVAAGSDAQPHLAPGECARIFTGANVPPEADTVVMREDTETGGEQGDGEAVRFLQAPTEGQHILRRGENARAGQLLIPTGARLNATHIGLCVAVGCSRVAVHGLPRVAVLTTGAELKGVDDVVGEHEIRDSNGPTLVGLLAQHQFPCVASLSAPDERDALTRTIVAMLDDCDVLLTTGGVSVGTYDLVPDAIREAGGEIVYHRIQIKPGRPQLLAECSNGKLVFGLPGNPLSAMVGVQEFVLPALRRMAGVPLDKCRPLWRLPLANEVRTKGKRQHHLPARLTAASTGLCIEPVPTMGSADLVAASKADGSIIVPAGRDHLAAGELADFRLWGDLS